MYFDGSLMLEGAGAGVLLISPKGEQLRYVLQLDFKLSNNAAEYEALLHGLRIAESLSINRLLVFRDSLVVINQVNKDWSCSTEKMSTYCAKVSKLESKFMGLEFHHVFRDKNVAADVLARLGSTRSEVPPGIFVQVLEALTVKEPDKEASAPSAPAESSVLVITNDWRADIAEYIRAGDLPEPKAEGDRVHRRSESYTLIGGQLYKRAVATGVLMKCIPREEGIELLEEIHSGFCGNHAGWRTLVGKAFRSGFYWSTTKQGI